MIKVIVFSNMRIYCEGLSQILSNIDKLEVVGAESSLDHATEQIDRTRPDVILLDMTMPGSCRMAQDFVRQYPHIKIVALAVPEDEQNIVECAEAGISGYVAREASTDELIKTVISTKKGEFCCPPKIAAFLFNKVQCMALKARKHRLIAADANQHAALQDLTRREKQVVSMIAEGLSNKEISKALVIEVSTVKNHVHNILVKLAVHNRIQAVALFQGTMQPDRSRSFSLGHRQEVYP